MMDHERTEKELEEIFEEIQHSYKTFADDAFALQEPPYRSAPSSSLESCWSTQRAGMYQACGTLWRTWPKGAGANASCSRSLRGRLTKPTRGCSRAPSMSIITRLSRPRQN